MLDSSAKPNAPVILPQSFPHKMFGQNASKRCVLIIDDDQIFAESLKAKLEELGSSIVAHVAREPFEGANLLTDNHFEFVIADCALRDCDGVTPLENADHMIDLDPDVEDVWKTAQPTKVLFCSNTPIRLIDLRRANKLNHFNLIGFLPKVAGVESITDSIVRHLNEQM